ncbi:MAG: ATP-binding protein [Acidobacteriota bacterium]
MNTENQVAGVKLVRAILIDSDRIHTRHKNRRRGASVGIRGRLLMLAIGTVVPLLLVSLVALWGVWGAKQQQLNDAMEQQAELAAVVFERWLDTQQQPLLTVAGISGGHAPGNTSMANYLRFVTAPRPHWIDIRIINGHGKVVLSHPEDAEGLAPALAEKLTAEVQHGETAVETDWTRGEGQYVLAVAVPVAVGGAVVARVDGKALQGLFRDLQLPDRALITLLDSQRRIIYRSQSPSLFLGAGVGGSALFTALGTRRTAVAVVKSVLDNVERVYGVARVGTTEYVMTVGVPSATLYDPARRQITRMAGFGLLALLCAVTAALLISRSITHPLDRLSLAARAFSEGNLSARAPIEMGPKLAQLVIAFNAMADRIEEREKRLNELDRLKSEFVSNASHELRTPLTTIKALTRLLLRGGLDESKQREYLETIAVECDRQIDLVLNLLDLSRIEAGAFELSLGRVDTAELLLSCLKSQSRAAEFRRHQLVITQGAGLTTIRACQKALRRVVGSLVDNAIKYTPDGGRITLGARRAGNEVEISVTDNGRGIPAKDFPILFDKFHRGRPAPVAADGALAAALPELEEVPGIGLGLYLARNVIEQMGGRISVESEVGHGSTFILHLPVWDDESGRQITSEEGEHGQTIVSRG